jgi:hypothetical protein
MRVKVLAHFIIGFREKDSQRFILAESYELPIAAREGHAKSHDQ